MKGNFSTERPRIKLLVFIGLILLVACVTIVTRRMVQPKPGERDIDPINSKDSLNAWNSRQIDSAGSLLQSGDLVIRQGIDLTSFVLSRMNLKDKRYSHCGLVMVEHGYPFIYHCIGGEDNPDETMRRDSLNRFLSPITNKAFGIARYDMDSSSAKRLKLIVSQLYKANTKFDADFDLKTDDRLYCAEFVYKALNKANMDSNYITASHTLNYHFIGVDNLFLSPHAHMIWQVNFK